VLLIRGRNTQFVQDSYHQYMRQFGDGGRTAQTWASHAPFYPALVDRIMQQGAFGMGVEIRSGTSWQPQGAVRGIGPAAMRTVAVPLSDAGGREAAGAPLVRVRLAVLPGGWEIDSAELTRVRPGPLHETTVTARSAVVGPSAGPEASVEAATLLDADGRKVRIPHGHALTLDFQLPARLPASRQTAVLSVTGYYEEHPMAVRDGVALRLGPTLEALVEPQHFAQFVLRELAAREQTPSANPGRGSEESNDAPRP
jgi:hypothetical protein